MAYNAIVAKISALDPHPNADRLQIATVLYNKVIVGLDQKVGDIGVFFEPDGQLSPEFCEANNLLRKKDLVTGKQIGGFFEENRRIRALKLRGVKSDGYWTSLKSLEFTGHDLSKLKEGDQLCELNGVKICNKYYTKATRQSQGQNKTKMNRRETIWFPMNDDTEHLFKFIHTICEDDLVFLTEKFHGTSQRMSFNLDLQDLPFQFLRRNYNQLASLIRLPKCLLQKPEYTYLYGSRRVILNHSDNPGYYGDNAFRYKVAAPLKDKIHKGEVWYYEIVGWVNENTPIMPPHDMTKLGPDYTKQYGETIYYKYGQPLGQADLYVYRITSINPDGVVIDLPWNLVKKRCREVGVKYVPELHPPILCGSRFQDELMELVKKLADGPSLADSSHIKEGCCCRVERANGEMDIYKYKSTDFKILEGILKENSDMVDPEDVA